MHETTGLGTHNFILHAFLDERTKGKYCLQQEAGRMIIDGEAATE